jgi:hypothetical protein
MNEPAKVKHGGWWSDDDLDGFDREYPALELDDQGWPIRTRVLTPATQFFRWPDPPRSLVAVSRIL